jgi:hypothetical protein
MKKFLIAILIIPFFSSALFAEVATCYVHKKVDAGAGQFEWKQSVLSCPIAGFDCQVTECSDLEVGDITPVEEGFSLNLTLVSVEFKLKDEFDNWNTFIRPGGNFTFNECHSIEISNCPMYPHLNGRSVNLNGITTDGGGNYSVFISDAP